MEAPLKELEAALGHRFARPELLLRAVTHRSLLTEQAVKGGREPEAPEHERLEFLGDAALGLAVAQELYDEHPEWREGDLTKARQQFVNRQHMAEVGFSIGLGRFLRLSKGEDRSGLRTQSTVISNHMESLLGALFADGGFEPVRQFVRDKVIGESADSVAQQIRSGETLGNFKSALQQHLQSRQMGAPIYRLRSESGPDHQKRYIVMVRLKPSSGGPGKLLAGGTGRSKKNAEQDAARRALARLTTPTAAENAEEPAAE